MKRDMFLVAIGIVAVGMLFAGILIGITPPINWDKQQRLCDKSVFVLLHSDNLVEVVRAGFLVLRMECAIGKRLTKEDIQ